MTQTAARAAFARQAESCIALGSPFMGQLMRLCATQDWPDSPVTGRIFGWQGDLGSGGQSVPLRLAGALHALHLQGNTTTALVYPPHTSDDATLWAAICQMLTSQADAINPLLDSAPQTNEVRRAATLIAAGHWLADRYDLPIRCSELGASAGLNLHWDAFALAIVGQTFGPVHPALTLAPDWTGAFPPATRPNVVARAGVDLNPVDPQQDELRLQAYLWPDQPHRLALTKAAIRVAYTSVTKGDAVTWLADQLSHTTNQLHLIYSTVAWQYFTNDQQNTGRAAIAAAGAKARDDAPLAWFTMESDGAPDGAALTLRLWPGDLTFAMGRADFHGRWVKWNPVPIQTKD